MYHIFVQGRLYRLKFKAPAGRLYVDKHSVEEDSLVPMRCQPREFKPLGGLTRLILACGVS